MGKERAAEDQARAGSAHEIGLISDTHGLLRNEVYAAFEGVDEIVHAGDVGDVGIIGELEVIAPVQAVYGNVDGEDVRGVTQETLRLTRGGRDIVVIHGHQLGSPSVNALVERFPAADIIVYGHTHQPLIEQVEGVLVVNPGSAGQRRLGRPVSAARLTLREGREPEVRLIELPETQL